MTPTNKTRFTSVVNGLDKLGDKSNNAVPGLAMGELYRYFAGLQAKSGLNKAKRDYWGNTTYNPLAATCQVTRSPAARVRRESDRQRLPEELHYLHQQRQGAGKPAALAEAQSHLTSLMGQSLTTIPLTPSGEQGNWSDEYAKYMASADCAPAIDGVQNVLTYTLDVLPSVAGSPDWTALLKAWRITARVATSPSRIPAPPNNSRMRCARSSRKCRP